MMGVVAAAGAVVVVVEEKEEEEGEEAGKARAINQTAGMAEWVFTPLRI